MDEFKKMHYVHVLDFKKGQNKHKPFFGLEEVLITLSFDPMEVPELLEFGL